MMVTANPDKAALGEAVEFAGVLRLKELTEKNSTR